MTIEFENKKANIIAIIEQKRNTMYSLGLGEEFEIIVNCFKDSKNESLWDDIKPFHNLSEIRKIYEVFYLDDNFFRAYLEMR